MSVRRTRILAIAAAVVLGVSIASPAVAGEKSPPPATVEEALNSGGAAAGIEFGITGPVMVSSGASKGRRPASEAPSHSSGDGVTTATAINVKCTATVDQPHFSSGAGGAIYKTRISCTGYGLATVSVKVNGLLRYDYASSSTDTGNIVWQTRASSSQTQTVVVNGISKTFYTPVAGNGGRGTGFWHATSTFQITSPLQSNVASKSYLVFKTI